MRPPELEPQPTPNPYLDKYHMLEQLEKYFGDSDLYSFLPRFNSLEKVLAYTSGGSGMMRGFFADDNDRLFIDATPSRKISSSLEETMVFAKGRAIQQSEVLSQYCRQLGIPKPSKIEYFYQPYIEGHRCIVTTFSDEINVEFYPLNFDPTAATSASFDRSNPDKCFSKPAIESAYQDCLTFSQIHFNLCSKFPSHLLYQTEIIRSYNMHNYVVQFKCLGPDKGPFYQTDDYHLANLSYFPTHKVKFKDMFDTGIEICDENDPSAPQLHLPDTEYVLNIQQTKNYSPKPTGMGIDYKRLKGVIINRLGYKKPGVTAHGLFRLIHLCYQKDIPVVIDKPY